MSYKVPLQDENGKVAKAIEADSALNVSSHVSAKSHARGAYDIYAYIQDDDVIAEDCNGSEIDTGILGTNDDDVLETAINAAKITGGILQISPGTWTINDAKVFASINGLHIRGSGRYRTIIKSKNGLNASALTFTTPQNLLIEDIGFDGNRANQTSVCDVITFSNPRQLTMRNFYLKDAYRDGIVLGATHANDGQNVLLCDFKVDGCGQNGIIANATGYGYGYRIWVHRGKLYDNAKTTNGGCGIQTYLWREVSIKDNYIDTLTASYDTTAGIRVHSSLDTEPASGVIVDGNTVRTSPGQGILVQNCYGAKIINNTCTGHTRCNGIYVENLGRMYILYNTVHNNGCGIALTAYDASTPHKSKVIGNEVFNTTYKGIYCDSNYVDISHNTIANSAMTSDPTYTQRDVGILLTGNNCDVSHNICYDDQTPKTQKYGISDYSAPGNIGNSNNFSDNNVSGNLTLGMYLAGKSNVVRNNRGFDIGVYATPFQNTYAEIYYGDVGGAAGPTYASTDYTLWTAPAYIISTGGTGVDITIKDSAGNTINNPGATCTIHMVPGWKINFGAFSVAPTVMVVFE